MPKVQIQKKSTWVDMTAFVDVSFLILSFFMLATKFKPPELVNIQNPKSVSSENVAEKDVFKVTFDKEGRCFISFSSDDEAKERIFNMLDVLKYTEGYFFDKRRESKVCKFFNRRYRSPLYAIKIVISPYGRRV